MTTEAIDTQLHNHISSLLDGWRVWFDFIHDDQGVEGNQFLIRSTGGPIDPHTGRVLFDLVAISASQDSSIPKSLLERVSAYLLTNFNINDIIDIHIVSSPRPSGLFSNNRPVYTMSIRLITERKEGL